MSNLLEQFIIDLKAVDTIAAYEDVTLRLSEMLQQEMFESEIIQRVRTKVKYLKNKFSDESTKENMINAKNSLIVYLEDILTSTNSNPLKEKQEVLLQYLEHFHLFLEMFREIEPDKRAKLTAENLQKIQIENEYDLQHILYAVLKPLFMDARKEVAEDSGIGTIRSDIRIASADSIIEAKCTRNNMSFKKLTEEIEADIVHYTSKFIYFYVYDKAKIIKDKYIFETNFSQIFDGKTVRVIILQPVKM